MRRHVIIYITFLGQIWVPVHLAYTSTCSSTLFCTCGRSIGHYDSSTNANGSWTERAPSSSLRAPASTRRRILDGVPRALLGVSRSLFARARHRRARGARARARSTVRSAQLSFRRACHARDTGEAHARGDAYVKGGGVLHRVLHTGLVSHSERGCENVRWSVAIVHGRNYGDRVAAVS